MNPKLTSLAALAAVLVGASYVNAALVQWTILSSASNVSLAIPDQALNLSGTAATARVRNQTGSSNVWNVGNKASLQGTFNTNYFENGGLGGGTLEFLFGADTVTSINSGNYRPNPAAFNGTNTNSTNPDGQFTNTSLAGGVYGAKLRATAFGLTLDIGYINLYNVSSQLGSPVLNLAGLPGTSTTPANGINSFGIEAATIALDGISALLIGQVSPDTFTSFANVLSANAAVGLITITTPNPTLDPTRRRMTIPISVSATTDLEGTPLTINTTGQIVAEAIPTIPEPSTLGLAGVGLVALTSCAHRRRMRRRSR